jgi:MFS family permease
MSFHLTSQAVGNYLVLQILGMIVSNAVWMKIINRTRTYKSILYVSLGLNMVLPVYALIAAQHQTAFLAVFVLAGFSLAAYEIVMSGILVEISTNENRALYTGISGTGSLLPVMFPILGGIFITKTGYLSVFLVAVLLMSVSVPFVKRIQCQEIEEENT